MRVFTHFPALAPAIRRAGYEPALLDPLECERGPVVIEFFDGAVAVGSGFTVLVFERSPDEPGVWRIAR